MESTHFPPPLSLAGAWRLRAAGETGTVACPIPGDNYSALQDAGRIPDPYRRDNEAKVQWVAEKDWGFSRSFDVPAALLRRRAVSRASASSFLSSFAFAPFDLMNAIAQRPPLNIHHDVAG